MTINPQMTVKQLRDALKTFAPEFDDAPITIWLPGSRIDLHQLMGHKLVKGELLIEGNLREGSALS